MVLVQLLLPIRRNDGTAQPADAFRATRRELVERFGGLTVLASAPAEGLWDDGDHVARDELLVFEILARGLDVGWWRAYRERLEGRFDQERIVVRALALTVL